MAAISTAGAHYRPIDSIAGIRQICGFPGASLLFSGPKHP